MLARESLIVIAFFAYFIAGTIANVRYLRSTGGSSMRPRTTLGKCGMVLAGYAVAPILLIVVMAKSFKWLGCQIDMLDKWLPKKPLPKRRLIT